MLDRWPGIPKFWRVAVDQTSSSGLTRIFERHAMNTAVTCMSVIVQKFHDSSDWDFSVISSESCGHLQSASECLRPITTLPGSAGTGSGGPSFVAVSQPGQGDRCPNQHSAAPRLAMGRHNERCQPCQAPVTLRWSERPFP